jgi:hypothetical protein
MLFTKPLLILAALAASTLANPTPSADLIDVDYYKANFAPSQLARLDKYRAEHTLTPEQDNFIGKLVEVVNKADAARAIELKPEAEALFGDQAYNLLVGDEETNNPGQTTKERLRREAVCSCTNGWGCNNGWHCPVSNTCHRHKGCGAFLLYVCNGVCVT